MITILLTAKSLDSYTQALILLVIILVYKYASILSRIVGDILTQIFIRVCNFIALLLRRKYLLQKWIVFLRILILCSVVAYRNSLWIS